MSPAIEPLTTSALLYYSELTYLYWSLSASISFSTLNSNEAGSHIEPPHFFYSSECSEICPTENLSPLYSFAHYSPFVGRIMGFSYTIYVILQFGGFERLIVYDCSSIVFEYSAYSASTSFSIFSTHELLVPFFFQLLNFLLTQLSENVMLCYCLFSLLDSQFNFFCCWSRCENSSSYQDCDYFVQCKNENLKIYQGWRLGGYQGVCWGFS